MEPWLGVSRGGHLLPAMRKSIMLLLLLFLLLLFCCRLLTNASWISPRPCFIALTHPHCVSTQHISRHTTVVSSRPNVSVVRERDGALARGIKGRTSPACNDGSASHH